MQGLVGFVRSNAANKNGFDRSHNLVVLTWPVHLHRLSVKLDRVSFQRLESSKGALRAAVLGERESTISCRIGMLDRDNNVHQVHSDFRENLKKLRLVDVPLKREKKDPLLAKPR